MKRILAIVALLWALSASALGPNGTLGTITVVNGNGNAGGCTAGSCAVSAFQQPASGTIFTGSDAKYSTLSVQLTGTWVGTVTFQFSQDEGATWKNYAILTAPQGSGAGNVNSTTANGNWIAPVAGITTFRAVATAWTSGTAAVALESLLQPVTIPQVGQPFFNDAVAGTVVQIKGTTGALQCVSLVNTTAAVAYLQIFFLPSTSVSIGVTAPDFDIRLLASAAFQQCFGPGLNNNATGTGISIAGTTTATGSTGAAISVAATYQ